MEREEGGLSGECIEGVTVSVERRGDDMQVADAVY